MGIPSSPQALFEQSPALAAHFRIAAKTRSSREKPRTLIVEDQLFSRKILEEVLRNATPFDAASSAKEGLRLFLENAPDIAFLDIELADDSGHTLASFIRAADPSCFIVMVTGNNSVEDVALAKGNKVDGFIVKPYNKSKILECVEKFLTLHPDRRAKG